MTWLLLETSALGPLQGTHPQRHAQHYQCEQAVAMDRRAVPVRYRSGGYQSEDWCFRDLRGPQLAVSPWEIPDAPPPVPSLRAVLRDFMPTKLSRGSRRWPATQPTLAASVLPLDALSSAIAAHMDPPRSKWPAQTLGARAPAADPAPQPTHADPTRPLINPPDESDILEDDFQSDAQTDFMFGMQGGNDQAKTREFGLGKCKDEEARLATIADVVSISFLMTTVVQGLAEWSWTFSSPESDLGRFQQEGILLSPRTIIAPSSIAVFRQPPAFTPNQTEVIARESASNSRRRLESLHAVALLPTPPQSTSSYPTMNTSFTDSSLGSSPVEPLVQDIDPFMAFQLGLYLGSTDPSLAIPDNSALGDLFSNTLSEDLFSGLEFPPEPCTYTPPHGSTSPATSLFDMDAMYLAGTPHLPADPLTPQPPCNRRARFRCPLTPATTARCARGFTDARTLHRHLWTHHKDYAREHAVPSEEARCPYPGCGRPK
ncbi:hypothetical protein B0I37DRAFT_356480 [Chaetomium sp. MPI-CAGE-AT-0009]|nr:hypothetical protein B0I37DRAFT_356480 [Chaetomium sp. MPI-CAGE-AT-0009]